MNNLPSGRAEEVVVVVAEEEDHRIYGVHCTCMVIINE